VKTGDGGVTYRLAVTVTAKTVGWSNGKEYTVTAELSGFEGAGKSGILSYAFDSAYDDLMSKVAEGVSDQ
jgi:hypothetical protein